MTRTALIFFLVAGAVFAAGQAHAQIRSPQYRIKAPVIDINPEENKVETVLSKDELNLLKSQGFVVRENEPDTIRVTLSHSTLTFENTPEQASNISTVLTVTLSGAGKYQATLQSQTPLGTVWGDVIAPTQCDKGCTVNVARPWTRENIGGFGYTLKGDDIPPDFQNISYFRPLPDRDKDEEAQTILSGRLNNDTRQATLIFRVNPDRNQPDGTYQTVINGQIVSY